jgi:dinuclear metal center YbgI/SA1388 family protein
MKLADLVAYLNDLLNTAAVPDYSQALNGLHLENYSGSVSKIAAAVDAHLPVVRQAAARGCDLLLVHHGLFWSGLQPLVGPFYEKLRFCGESDLAVYSAHLPLDGHEELGNGIQLAKALELGIPWEPFFPYKNYPIGVRGDAGSVALSRADLALRLEKATGAKPHVCWGGPENVGPIGIVTGGAGSEVAAMKALGITTFITGEGPHWSYTLAEELGVNLLYGGHYATETFGVKALAARIGETFDLPWEFIDHPTGL